LWLELLRQTRWVPNTWTISDELRQRITQFCFSPTAARPVDLMLKFGVNRLALGLSLLVI